MGKVAKIVLITAIILVVAGIGLTVAGAIIINKNGAGNKNYTKKEMVVTENFKNIDIEEVSANVEFMPSADGQVKIEYYDSDNDTHKIEVSGDTLKIVYKDNDNMPWWLRINFGSWWNTSDTEIVTTIYLPAGEYGSLDIDTVSGDMKVPADYSFSGASYNSISGDVSALCKTSGDVKVNTTSGEIKLASINGNSVGINTVSGNVALNDVSVTGKVDIDTTSGEVGLTNVVSGTNSVSTVSGDVTLAAVNADSISISTTSGDVKGTVAGEHEFDIDTVSGDITLPSNIKGKPMVEIDTVSGDVNLDAAA